MMSKSSQNINNITATFTFYANQAKEIRKQREMSQFMVDQKAKIKHKSKTIRKRHMEKRLVDHKVELHQ